jgi:photosystem II stability/assembly factor-like uncharacterized protein
MMKTILKANITFFLFILLLFIVFVNVNAQGNGQWEILNEGGDFQTIDFVSDNVGWIAGEGTLLKTEDGGETWNIVSLPEEIYFDKIDFCDDSIAWAMGQIEGNEKRSIFRSNDEGQSWVVKKEFQHPYGFDSFYAVNDSVVYAVGLIGDTGYPSGWVMKTTDAGLSWEDVTPFSPITYIDFNAVYFFDEELGVAAGMAYDKESFVRTLDGGKTWNKINAPEFVAINNIQFITKSTGYFLARNENDENFLCVTTDTLNSWVIKMQSNYTIHSYFVTDDEIIFAVMDDSISTYVIESIDGGLTWQRKDEVWEGGEIYFTSNNVGYILNGAKLKKSSDGGEEWRIQKFTHELRDSHFFDDKRGLAGGGDVWCHMGCWFWGALFSTNDGGATWEEIDFGEGMLRSLFFFDDEVGYALSESNGFIVNKTTDGGKSWAVISENNPDSSGYSFDGKDLCFFDDQIGLMAGKLNIGRRDTLGSAILLTKDGGETWDLAWKYPDSDLRSYKLLDIHAINRTAWAVCESGMIVKYSEPRECQEITNVTDLPLYDIFFSDEQHGWVAGGYYYENNEHLVLFKTTDGGESWQEIPDFEYQVNDMYFENNLHGWAVGSDTSDTGNRPPGRGVILQTSDGGDNWNIQIDDLSAPLNAIHFKDGFGWAVGGNGLVLRTEDGASWVDQNTGKSFPNKFSLSQNYPNPFNPSTKIKFTLPKMDKVRIDLYNTLGQRVETLLNQQMKAGQYEIEFNAQNLSSGIYFYRLETQTGYLQTKKLVVLK